jgi:hypothetical protein
MSSHITPGKCCLKGRKVVGTLKGINFDEIISKAMSNELRDKAPVLFQSKNANQVARAAMTSSLKPPLSEMLDKLESLSRASDLSSPPKMVAIVIE